MNHSPLKKVPTLLRGGTPRVDYVVPDFSPVWTPDISYLPNGWGVTLADVSPDLAEMMLCLNDKLQRDCKSPTVSRYARDMAEGLWLLTHQGIAFNRRGSLHDGQHRLQAVVESGATVPFVVFFGAGDQREMVAFDTHRVRTTADASSVTGTRANTRCLSILHAMVRLGVTNGTAILAGLTQTTRLRLFERHRRVLEATNDWFGATKLARHIGQAPVMAAVACAAYHLDHTTLKRFAAVLTEQADPVPTEMAAARLRQMLIANKPGASEAFLKTCKAIQHFLKSFDPGRSLYACPENPFPIAIDGGDETV